MNSNPTIFKKIAGLIFSVALTFQLSSNSFSCPALPYEIIGKARKEGTSQVLTAEKLLELKRTNPDAFQKLLKEEPGYDWILKDLEFAEMEKMPGGIQAALWAKYGDDFDTANTEYGRYIRRKTWKAANFSETRPLPGYPGGPRRTEVDKILQDPYLPPTHKKNVAVSEMKFKNETYTAYFEPNAEKINLYDSNNARVGAFEYQIQSGPKGDNTVLKVSIAAVDPSLRGQGIADALYKKVLDNLPEVKTLKGNLAYTNAKAFWTEYKKTGNYFDAVKATPAYKSRAKLGFSKIEPPDDFPPENWDFETQIPLLTSKPD